MVKVLVLYHSLYSHIHKMAQAVADGAKSVKGAEVRVMQVPETMNNEVLSKMGATESKQAMSAVQVAAPQDLEWADAVLVGTPTRFGNMTAQMRAFWDHTGGLWAKNALVGKAAGVFTSSATQHGGQESTILSTHITLLHHGFVVVGLPYTEKGQMTTDEITGGSPYGASTIAGGDGSRQPSKNELELARAQGRHVAEIGAKLGG